MNLSHVSGKVREAILEFLLERFSIHPEVFQGLEFLDNGKGRIFALEAKAAGFAVRSKVACASLPFVRLDGSVKPTSAMIQLFGRHARKSVIKLGKKEAKDFMEGFDLDVRGNTCTDGYVAVKYLDYPLGCGLLRGEKLKNMLPKAKRMPVGFL